MKIATTAGDIWVTFCFERDALFAFWGGEPGERNWPSAAMAVGASTFSVRGLCAFRQGSWTDEIPGVPRPMFAPGADPTPEDEATIRAAVLVALTGASESSEAQTAKRAARLAQQLARRQRVAAATDEIAQHVAAIDDLE